MFPDRKSSFRSKGGNFTHLGNPRYIYIYTCILYIYIYRDVPAKSKAQNLNGVVLFVCK